MRCVAVLLLLAAGSAAAQNPPPWQIEAGIGVESLSTGAPDWRQLDLALRHRSAPRTVFEAGLRRAERYGTSDDEVALAAAFPLDATWSLALRGTAADAPRFLPRLGASAELSRGFEGGWVASAGFGRNLNAATADAPPSGTSILRLGVERYLGAWRWSGGVGRARLDGGDTALGWRLQADRYFGDEARIGLLLASGDELENAPGGVLSSRVDALVLVGRWPLGLGSGWALTGDIGRNRIRDTVRRTGAGIVPTGSGYRRSGGRIGVQREF